MSKNEAFAEDNGPRLGHTQRMETDYPEIISTREWEEKQRNLFNQIALQYEQHYSDAYSQKYRAKFFYRFMTEGVPLQGKNVLEAMCGSGQMTHYLLAQGARVTGLDISSKLIDSFKKNWPSCRAVCESILGNSFEDGTFDAVMAVGGFHHLHPHIHQAVDEIYRTLKPGGYFCFVEPHSGSWPDSLRKNWYRKDRRYFEKNEASVDLDELERKNTGRFDFLKRVYGGNIAYMLVYNSLIFRIPLAWKRFYSPILLGLESLTHSLHTPAFSCFAISQWKKK